MKQRTEKIIGSIKKENSLKIKTAEGYETVRIDLNYWEVTKRNGE